MTGKTGKSGTRKKKGGGRWIILGLLLAIVTLAAACGLIYSCGSSTKDVTKHRHRRRQTGDQFGGRSPRGSAHLRQHPFGEEG